MTDTNSLFYEIKADDFFKDLYDKDSTFKNMFDNSNFSKTNLISLMKLIKLIENWNVKIVINTWSFVAWEENFMLLDIQVKIQKY